jgi:hypothetical protein
MNKPQIVTVTALALLIGGALACGSGPLAVGGPTPEYPTVAVSTESAGSLVDKLSALNAAAGEVTVSITEAELTSFMADKLTSTPDATFSDPQVFLRDGKIKLYTVVTTSSFTANALIVLNTPVVDGNVTAAIEKADFGPIPVPTGLLDSLTQTVNDNLLSLINKLPAGVQLKSIAIADGVMTLTANVK